MSNESNEPVYFDDFKVADARARIIEENHYYAFGLKIAGISSVKLDAGMEGSLKNNNLYNDKEIFDDADLDWYDYGFRNYDPQIGRFTQLDPMTDFYPDLTPFQYASDEPIANIDLDGLEKLSSIADFTYNYAQTATTFTHITTQAVSDATHLTPLLKLTSIIPKAAQIAGDISKASLEKPFKRPPMRVGFDWQGKGALPLNINTHKGVKSDLVQKSLELGEKVAENGEYISRLIQKNSLAKKFEFSNTILTGLSLFNNLQNNNNKGAFLDVIDLGISRTSLAPYYYGAKTTYEIFNSDYMQSAGYQQALEDERNTFYRLRQLKEGSFEYEALERQIRQSSESIRAYESRWIRNHQVP